MAEFRNFYLTVLNGRETPIGSVNELKNYINHLFRTDKAQRWTNSITPKNWVIMPAIDRDDVFYMGEGKDRKSLNQTLVQTIKALLLENPNDHLLDCDVLGFLYTFKIVWTDDDDVTVNQAFGADELANIVQKFYNTNEAVLLTVVCHQDEGNQHLHGLFLWVPGDINRIAQVLASQDVLMTKSNEQEVSEKVGIDFATEDDSKIKPVSESDISKKISQQHAKKVNWSELEPESESKEELNDNINSDSDDVDYEDLDMDESEEDE